MKNRILSMLLALLMIFSAFPVYDLYASVAEKEVSVWHFNSATEALEEVGTVEMYRGGELYVFAVLRDDISGNIQWQIEAGEDFWVDIHNETAEDLRISYGMIQSLLIDNSVRMRCAVLADVEYYSDPFTVVATEFDNRIATDTYNIERTQSAPEPLPAPTGVSNLSTETESASEIQPFALSDGSASETSSTDSGIMTTDTGDSGVTDEDVKSYIVTIEYVYSDASKFKGSRVALPCIAEAVAGGTLDETVISPPCIGYTPDIASIDLSTLGPITKNISLTVQYSPATVSYTIRHYQQNIDDDEYTWVGTTMAQGLTEALTSDEDAAKTYVGFTALSHYREEIAADSSTMIDIYYDRNYYLMSFDLDGGYGVEAVYARYGAGVSVSEPKRSGYNFIGWSLDGTTETLLPDIMPAGNSHYTALWEAGSTSYTIAYWLENADTANQYDFVDSLTVTANSGITVSGSDDAVAKGIISSADMQYYTYNADKTDTNVTVAGDNSTVVNIYYDRNEYVFRFYFARSYVENGTTYYQISHSNSYYDAVGEDVSAATWEGKHTTKPLLADKYIEQTGTVGTNTTYTYYYFDLKVKYGQNISDIWPHTPITNAEDATVFGRSFVSWGTQPGSGYHNRSNPNIKGPYSTVTSELLVNVSDVAPTVNHNLVAYYGAPTMWTVYVYYSAMAGETATKTYDGQPYVLQGDPISYGAQISSVEQLDVLAFPGVEYVGSVNFKNNNDETDNYSTQWYYKRIGHTFTFDDNYGGVNTYTIPFGATLSLYITSIPTPDYPSDLPPDAYEFSGWYQSKDGVGKLDTSTTMSNEDVIYYAKWDPKVYTVTISDGNGTVLSTESVNYSDKATAPTDPTMPEAEFIGWYYTDESGIEQRFDFANMTIIGDMVIYAKWRSNVMKQVEIYYFADENGTLTQIADTETLMMRLGQTRTFEAKTGNSLYEDYRAGCFPTTASHSITIQDEDIDKAEPVTYTFVYKKYGAVPYQVEFYVQDANGNEYPAFMKDANGQAVFVKAGDWNTSYTEYVEEHWDNNKAIVTELYVPDDLAEPAWKLPDAYLPNALKIQKIIVPSETDPEHNIAANTIRFVYAYTEPVVPDNPDVGGGTDPDDPVYQARYLVQHFIQSSTNTGSYELYSYSDEVGLSGGTAVASAISIPGYTFSAIETSNRKQTGTALGADNTLSGTITADDTLELNFYYTVNSYHYQVMYLEEGTNRVLSPTKTTDDIGDPLKGNYGSKVTETAIDISGYDVVGSASQSIYIQMEVGDTAGVNTIVFYYKLKSAELVISKAVELDPDQAAQEGISEIPAWVYNQEFTFTIYKADGFPKSVYDYTITDLDGNLVKEDKVIAGVQTIVVSLKHGQKITLHDLPMGTYEVTETYVPGFTATVGGYIAQEHTVELDEDGEVGTLQFVNRFPFYTGDLVIKKNVTKLDANDPTAIEPYKVTVVLTPDDAAREVDRVITFVDANGNALTDANGRPSFIIHSATNSNDKIFTVTVLVPVDGEVKMQGVPVGSFIATEEVKGTVGYIYDYYTVKYNKAVHENDEVTGTNNAVSGSIHGGHPTAVTFNNTYKKGSLIVNKTVTQEYVNDNWTSDTFTFTITGITELPDGHYLVDGAIVTVSNGVVTVKDSNENDPSITITKSTDGATSWSESLTFENLPAGYYTVTETAGLGNDRYIAAVPGEILVNDTENPQTAAFLNTYKRTAGNLQVGKKIVIVTEGSIIDTDQPFTFIVEPKDSVLTGSYSYTIKSTNNTDTPADDTTVKVDTLPVEDGKLTFKLQHNQYILIEGLPTGNYLVKEEAIEGYDSSFGSVLTDPGNYSVDPATISANRTTVLNCQNAYPVYYSNLIVKKQVATPADHSAADQAPEDDVFTFTISISDYSDKVDLTNGITAKYYENDSDTTPAHEEAILLNNDVLTFTLKAGEWVDLNLPACTYTIAETGLTSNVNSNVLADHYTTAYTVGDVVGEVGKSYALVSGEVEAVIFTNTYKRHYLDLIITTACTNNEQSFIFDVSATGTALGDIKLTVVLSGNDSQTIRDLPVGTYTIIEQNNWSWRETAVNSQTVELKSQSVTVPFNFATVDNIYWLSGYSYRMNRMNGGG